MQKNNSEARFPSPAFKIRGRLPGGGRPRAAGPSARPSPGTARSPWPPPASSQGAGAAAAQSAPRRRGPPGPPGPPRAEGAAGTAPPCSGPFGAVRSRPARGAPSCSGRGGCRQRASCKCLLCLLFFKRGSQGGLWLRPSDSAAAPHRPFYSLKSRFLKAER